MNIIVKTVTKHRGLLLLLLLLIMIAAIVLFTRINSSPKKIRNVVLISIDTCRADHLSCYGYSQKTSQNIDKLAKSGVLFTHVVTTAPLTLPAHCSMLTGTTPLVHNVRNNNSVKNVIGQIVRVSDDIL